MILFYQIDTEFLTLPLLKEIEKKTEKEHVENISPFTKVVEKVVDAVGEFIDIILTLLITGFMIVLPFMMWWKIFRFSRN